MTAPNSRVNYGSALSIAVAGQILGLSGIQVINNELDFTLSPETSPSRILHTGTLTSDVVCALATVDANGVAFADGAMFDIRRTGSGAYNLAIGTGPLVNLRQNTGCRVVMSAGAWMLWDQSYPPPAAATNGDVLTKQATGNAAWVAAA